MNENKHPAGVAAVLSFIFDNAFTNRVTPSSSNCSASAKESHTAKESNIAERFCASGVLFMV